MFGRAMMAAGWHVAADHLADRLGPFPANIAFMGVRHKRQPIGTCLPARLHTGGAVACRHSRLTISIGAAVDGVLDHPMDGGVVRAPPNRIAVLALHRKVEIMPRHSHMWRKSRAKLPLMTQTRRHPPPIWRRSDLAGFCREPECLGGNVEKLRSFV